MESQCELAFRWNNLGCMCKAVLGEFFFFCNQGQIARRKFKKDHLPTFFLK